MSIQTVEFGLEWRMQAGVGPWLPMSFRLDSEEDGRDWLRHFNAANLSSTEYRLMSRTVTRTESAWEAVE